VITIEPNKELFTAYAGLTAAGYDLADKNDEDIAGLCRHIREMHYPQSVIDYFANARTNQNKVNPYWPRGSLLSSACFFISGKRTSRYETFEDLLQFVHSLHNINQKEINDEVINWLQQLPRFIDVITSNDGFDELWRKYRRIIDMRMENYTKVLDLADQGIRDFGTNSSLKFPDILFSPNLLQSPYLADFVTKGNNLFIIKTAPDILSIIHESLHSVISLQREYFKEYVRKHDFAKIADAGKLSSSGYMWNESEESMINVLEESFVRGISIAVTAKVSDFKQIDNYVRWDLAAGLKLVPIVVQHARNNMPDSENIRDFVNGVMDSVF
jgi:hypothetical protein